MGVGVPVIILVGIYAGVMTPTEAAAVTVAYVLIVELFIYRSITWKEVFQIGVTSGRMVSMIFILIGAGSLLSWILTGSSGTAGNCDIDARNIKISGSADY